MASPASGPGKPIFGGNRRKLGDTRPLPVKRSKGTPIKTPKAKGPIVKPQPIDERIVRTMPITEKQLGQIKKAYGVK